MLGGLSPPIFSWDKLRLHGERRPDVRHLRIYRSSREWFRRDPHYRKCSAIEFDHPSEDLWIAVKSALPERVAQHRNRVRAGCPVLVREEAAAQQQVYSEV